MPHADPGQLAKIRRFDQLLAYLRDELDWPIDDMEIDDLTFDYEPEELGLDPNVAAKIKSIKQLRPLDATQPFGIFFVEFEPKRLPVTALRRILGRLVTKKRESANPTGRATWKQDDLIFISAYGEGDSRRIDFAHFADDAQNGLPTLRVLGWDKDDTPLRAEWVENQLRQRLLWPDDANAAAWRDQWRSAFVERHREAITTSKKLAQELAALAQRIRARVTQALAVESDTGPLHKLYSAFRDSLIHDLTEDGFADMYAQTITYGLLSAGVSRFVPGEGVALLADDAASLMPPTSPFLKELLDEFVRIGGRHRNGDGTGIDFDELGVNDVVDTLRHANMDAVLRDFGRTKPGEDPVIHFYEDFMVAYDREQRVKRGVYYTPKPVVSFIVRSVDEVLREEFDLPLGLADTTTWDEMAERHADITIPDSVKPADPFVQILDPACGTGTFLVETIDLIHGRMRQHWLDEGYGELELDNLWNGYVAEHLLARLHGFELMMAPYAICHMKVGLKLRETGYRFKSSQRLRVYLTNSLEPPQDLSEMLEFVAPFLAHEARAANVVKEHLRPTVVIGNPPYAAISSNLSKPARALVERCRSFSGKPIRERGALQFEKNINDDYVKFIRFGETFFADLPGVMGYICNNGYLEAPTLRGLRESLANTFDRIRVLDLHGDQDRRERASDGSPDRNVFDIKRGVAVGLFSRSMGADGSVMIGRQDMLGSRQAKYDWLLSHTVRNSVPVTHIPGGDLLVFAEQCSDLAQEWTAGMSIRALFGVGSTGFEAGRDEILVDYTSDALLEKLRRFAQAPDAEVRAEFPVKKAWGLHLFKKRKGILADGGRVMPVLMTPFDWRFCMFRKDLLKTNSWSAGQHLRSGDNIAIICMRQVVLDTEYYHVSVSRTLVNNRAFASQKGKTSYLPLFLDFETRDLAATADRQPNVAESDLVSLGYSASEDSGPHGLLHLIVAETASKTYRSRYDDLVRRDFPRVFRPVDTSLRHGLEALGADLIALHLLEDDYPHASWNQPGATKPNPLAQPMATFHDEGDREVRKAGEAGKTMAPSPQHGEGFGRVYVNDTAYFDGVPEEVWNFHIGGYQVCHKWLSDRKKKGGKKPRPGRVLTDDDIAHYCRVVTALHHTIRLMGEIDEVIEAHGG